MSEFEDIDNWGVKDSCRDKMEPRTTEPGARDDKGWNKGLVFSAIAIAGLLAAGGVYFFIATKWNSEELAVPKDESFVQNEVNIKKNSPEAELVVEKLGADISETELLVERIGSDGSATEIQSELQEEAEFSDLSRYEEVISSNDSSAISLVEDGKITLVGSVPDQATHDALVDDFKYFQDLEAVNNLVIDPSASAPSGKIELLDSSLFASNSSEMENGSEKLVQHIIGLLDGHPEWNILVIGHTDNSGNEATNLTLSFDRANAVRDGIVEGGIDASRISFDGLGSSSSIASNETEEGRAFNRRVTVEVFE